MTGEGEMLKPSVQQTSYGDHSPNVNGNGNSVGFNATIDRAFASIDKSLAHNEAMLKTLDAALAEIASHRELVDKSLAEIAAQRELAAKSMAQLIEIIQNKK